VKSLKSSWKVGLVAVASFAFGAWLFRVPAVKADPQGLQTIRITAVPMQGPGSRSGVASGMIVGFSCVPDTTNPGGTPGDGICYIASR
jgi:hypothetical protein